MKERCKKFLAYFLIVGLLLSTGVFVPSEAKASVTVNSEAELVAALASSETEVVIGSDFAINSDISVTNKTVKLIGGAHTLTGNTVNMFVISGGTVTFENLNFNANQKGRALKISGGASVAINGGEFSNGVSWINDVSISSENSDGGAIYATGGSSLSVNGASFSSNLGVTPNPAPRDEMNGHGGAIYAYGLSNLTIENSNFENNVSGVTSGGGAIYVEGTSQFTSTGNTFTGNHTNAISTNSNQGGAMYVHSTNYVGQNNTYNVARTFNTGGAIYFHTVQKGKSALEQNSTFTIGALGDGFGISGGAIMLGDSDVTIENSTFTSTDQSSKVTHAGGFISVAPNRNPEPNRLTVRGSTFTGNGSWWNGPGTATYGGAIAFETGDQSDVATSNAIALIENSTFRNIAADDNGGAITLNTKPGFKGNVNLTLKNSTIENSRTRFAWKRTIGGGIYNGEGNTVRIEGGNLNGSFAFEGGSIYNEGTMTITDGATLRNNTSYRRGGGIFNNGTLTVDNATLNGNRSAENKDYPGSNTGDTKKEMIGGNIYAKKDVTITPNATFDSNDIRVLDKESAILLTGALTKQINVSISETKFENRGFESETQERYIGYTVAKGAEGYTPVKADADKLHYISKDTAQAVSAYDDQTSLGKWDFVFNPEENTVVVGQRVKMVYDPNSTNFPGGKFEDLAVGASKEKLYDLYTHNIVNIEPIADRPIANDGYRFNNWYKVAPSVTKASVKEGATNPAVAYPFDTAAFLSGFNGNKVTRVLTANEYSDMTVAGYLNKTYNVTYTFEKAEGVKAELNLPEAVMAKLTGKNKTDQATGTVVGVSDINTDSVRDEANKGTWNFVSWDKETATIADSDVAFLGKWTFEEDKYKVTHTFIKADGVTEALPEAIKSRTTGKDIENQANGTEVSPNNAIDTATYEDTTNHGVWTFTSWDAQTKTINGANVEFIGKWTFTKNKFKVTHEFKKADTVTVNLPAEIADRTQGKDILDKSNGDVVSPNGEIDKAPYEDSTNDGTWTFKAWDNETLTINNADGKFIGTWDFAPNKYQVTHEFVKKEGVTKELPSAISDRTTGKVIENLLNGAQATPLEDIDKTEYVDNENDGKWIFEAWDKEQVVINKANDKFVGTWNFVPNTYTQSHEFVSGTQGKDLPEALVSRTANKDKTGLVDKQVVSPNSEIDTATYNDSINDGTWTFKSWDKDEKTVEKADVKFIGTWTFVSNKYQVTHEFVKAQGITVDLPEAIRVRTVGKDYTDLLDGADVTPKADIDKAPYKDEVNDGTWTFVAWDKEQVTINKANDKFVGTWDFTPNKYQVLHEFVKKSTVTKELPSEIANRVNGKVISDLLNGANVTPLEDIDKTEYVDNENDGKWTFEAWDKESLTINKANDKFVGTWNFVPNTYTQTHELVSGTQGKDLPEELVSRVANKDKTGLVDKQVVSPNDKIDTTSYNDGVNDGTWTFATWDNNQKTVDKGNVKFVGTWTFVSNKYQVTHEFVKAEGITADLPEAISGRTAGKDYNDLVDGAEVMPKADIDKAPYSDEVNDGTWTFVAWDKEQVTINKANDKFIGTWTFKANTYTQTHEFISGTEGKVLPEILLARTKDKDKAGLLNKTQVMPDKTIDKTDFVDEANDGTWTFKAWDKDQKTVEKANVKFVGTWIFTPKTYVVIHEFISGTEGKVLPEAIARRVDGKDLVDLVDGTNVLPNAEIDLSVYEDKANDGKWHFVSWDKANLTIKKANDKFVGKWVFSPNIVPSSSTFSAPKLNTKDHYAYMFGYPDGTFLQNRPMTRGEAVSMFARLLEVKPPKEATYNLLFKDVTMKNWHGKAIGFMTENGIASGYPDGTFRPDKYVTRAEFATLAARFEKLSEGSPLIFSDLPNSHWAKKYIDSAAAKGWISGYPDGTFKPEQPIIRSEVVTITNRMLNRKADVAFVDKNVKTLEEFTDLAMSHWAYYDIMEATNGHDYERLSDGKEERWVRQNYQEFRYPITYRFRTNGK